MKLNKSYFALMLLFILSFPVKSYGEILTLSEGLKYLIENNRSMKIAQKEESIYEANTILARAALLPEIDASASFTKQAYQPAAKFGLQTVPLSEKDFLHYSINIQQTLFDFKGNYSKFQASKVILNTKRYDTLRIKNMVSLNFLINYFDLLEADKMVIVAQKEVERLESHLKDARNLFEEGLITKNDLLQAEVKISDAKQRLLSAKNNREIIESRLNTLLARPTTEKIEAVDIEKEPLIIIDHDLEKAWELAKQNRVEIKIIDESLRALDLEKISKQSEYFPKMYLKGGYDYTENSYQVHESNWSLMLGTYINLFSGGATKSELLKIENQKLQMIEQRNKLIDEIKLEVERYYIDIKNALERINVTKDSIQQAEENLRINKVKYEEGIGTATDVIDAVTLLTIAETNYYKALYDLRRAQGGFIYSIGENLQEAYN
jgi:outer membrane protein TolC